MMWWSRLLLSVLLLLPATGIMRAQLAAYKWDAGIALGMSGYLGEANSSNIFASPGFAATASMRYLVNTRWAFRGALTAASLKGNSARMDNVLPGGATYTFSSSVYDLGLRAEFNFFNYGIGETYRHLYRWTPYITAGAGVTVARSAGASDVAASIPVGVGLKYKLQPRVNLNLEWSMTKVLGDKVDGPVLDDLYGIRSSFIKNTDWVSTITIGISYEFGSRCESCYYVD